MLWEREMGLTVIRAVVNMSPYLVNLSEVGQELESTGISVEDVLPGVTVGRFDMAATDIRVPWCPSQREFDRRHLQLSFVVAGGLGYSRISYYTIWQQSIGGVDLVRLAQDGPYVDNARGLPADRAGFPLYTIEGDSDCILVADERQWIILNRLSRG
jgi:hypothetical protein